MARDLSTAAILAVTGLEDDAPFLQLLEITLADETVIRVVRNTEDVTFEDHTYQKFNFQLEALPLDTKGSPPELVIKVSNVTRALQGYLEEGGGGVGATCRLIVIHADNIGTSVAELDETFICTACKSDASWVHFTLSTVNVHLKKFPRDRFLLDHCRWNFNYPPGTSPECGYQGEATSCTRKFARCKQLGNQVRFGGFPSMVGGGVYALQ